MATISLTLPTPGTVIAAGLHATNYATLQALANGGIDNNNFASGLIFDNTKIMQGGATSNQVLAWNGSIWAPRTALTTGTVTVTFPGGSQISNGVVVTHGLGRTPTSVVATMTSTVTGLIMPAQIITITSTQFTILCQTTDGSSPAAAANAAYLWIAA